MRGPILCSLLIAFSLARSSAASGDDQRARQAKALAEEATKQYDLGDYRQALDAYKAAYLAKPDPVFLFNIAQCYRLMGEPEEAAASYKVYLRKRPDAENRETVEGLIRESERAAAQRKAPPTGTLPAPSSEANHAPVSAVQSTSVPVPKATEDTSRNSQRRKWWIVGASIGAAVITGLAVGLGAGLGAGGDAPTHANTPTLTLSF